MHPLAPVVYAVLVVNAEPEGGCLVRFAAVAMATLVSTTIGHVLMLAVFALHLVDVVTALRIGTASAIVFSASASLDDAVGLSSLVALHRAIALVRSICLVGGIIETASGRQRLAVRLNNVFCMALAVYAPASVSATWLMATTIIPGKLYITWSARGAASTAMRLCVGTAVFTGIAGHERAFELSTALAAALSL